MSVVNEVELNECSSMDDVVMVAEIKAMAMVSGFCEPLGGC